MEEREYTRIGNDCMIYCKNTLTNFQGIYVVTKMIKYSHNNYSTFHSEGFENYKEAKEYFEED